MINVNNLILNTDSYKISHFKQYPPGTTNVYSYAESRGGVFPETVFFGLQAFIKEYLLTPVTMQDVDEAELVCKLHGFADFNREMWEHIVNVHNGRLPVRIRAVPEGTVLPTKNVLVTIENTDPKCYALTSYLETALLRAVWYPTTVATLSYNAKKIIKHYLEKTADDTSGLLFKFHDFGSRGVSSKESAGLGGLAHLVNFYGTDTIEALLCAGRYYNVDLTKEVPGFSIPAAEHSTITSWGRENEEVAYRNMLRAYGREGSLLAVVSDSYDIYNACENLWGGSLREEVIKSGATLVVRPDSGHPPTVVRKCLELLGSKFGVTVNSKGYKVLNYVRVIQGDGIDLQMLTYILEEMRVEGWSADNLAFGCGGGLLQKVDRDTLKFALKCSSIEVNGERRDVFKNPITDRGKVSKKGRVTLLQNEGGSYFSGVEEMVCDEIRDALVTVFENGELLVNEHFETIRKRAAL